MRLSLLLVSIFLIISSTFSIAAAVAPSAIPKTGQTIGYVSGDDGTLKKGVAWPIPRFTDNSKDTAADLTLNDTLTGLVWAKSATATDPIECTLVMNKTWQGVLDYVGCLNRNGYLGKCDWRLPNTNELLTLINWGVTTPAVWLNSQGFSDVKSNVYWTSSSYSSGTSAAWYVDMNNGDWGYNSKIAVGEVWPVRAGTSDICISLAFSLKKTGNGSGTVISSTGGINCGSTCSASIASGTSVILTATPDSGSSFAGWTGCDSTNANQCTVTVNGAKSVTATFNTVAPSTYSVTYNANGGVGTMNDANSPYLTSAAVTVLSNSFSKSGYTFGGWYPAADGSGTVYGANFTMDSANVTLYAKWTPVTDFTVTPSSGSGFTIDPAISQIVSKNGITKFTLVPSAGYGVLVTGCSGTLSGNTYTTGAITDNCTVTVTALKRNGNAGISAAPSISDALKVLLAYTGSQLLTPEEQIRYDVAPFDATGIPQGNGAVDLADVIMILRRSVGIGSW